MNPAANSPTVPTLPTLHQRGLRQCHSCLLLMRRDAPQGGASRQHWRCPRCGVTLPAQTRIGMDTSAALLLGAAVLYVPANALPMMLTNSGFDERSDTILSGVVELASEGAWGLSLIVFVASVMIPIFKIGALAYLMASVHWRWPHDRRRRTRLYRLLELIGRWSMLDVFVVGLMAALVQLGPAAQVQAGPAAVAFGLVVWLTLWATRRFDPRLIWDDADE